MLYSTRCYVIYHTLITHMMLCYKTHDMLCYKAHDMLCYITPDMYVI